MPPRPRGKMHRGGGGGMRGGYGGHGGGHGRGHWDRDHHGGGGGRGGGGGGYRGRGRGGGHRGGRPDYYHGRRGSRSPPPRQRHDPEKLLAGLEPEAQLALTTAIINSVLKSDGREGRGNFRDRERPHHRDARRDGRGGGYFREESRERRHYGDERRSHDPRQYHEEGRGHRYEREKSTSGSPRYRNNRYSGMARRRPSPHGHPGPSRKRQRVERMDSGEGGSTPHHDREFEGDDSYEQERERPRERRHRSPGGEEQRKSRDGEGTEDGDEKEEGPDGPSGVQVTIRADGERAVNSEGHVRRVSGRLFVELRCPHCPSQKSITFKEYKFHLGSDGHKSQLNRLARKHSVVLRKIRIQQRQEQRDIEEKWKEDKAEEFKNVVSKFCSTCKLAFKCLGSNVSDGISLHNRSKLHRMQRHYLHPRCGICHITFPSRMVYEYHIASINHLRVRTATIDNNGGEGRSDEQDQEEDDDVLDLANFMTLDSVGEDDEEVGSEHEEITEGLEEVEAAESGGSIGKRSSKGGKRRRGAEDDEISVDADWDKEHLEEGDDDSEPLGMEYVTRIEAYFCTLCCKVIRGDTSIGSRCVQRHCRSFDHIAHVQDALPTPAEEEDEEPVAVKSKGKGKGSSSTGSNGKKEVEGDTKEADSEGDDADYEAEVDRFLEDDQEEDPEQEKLWEEVDQGLTALQGCCGVLKAWKESNKKAQEEEQLRKGEIMKEIDDKGDEDNRSIRKSKEALDVHDENDDAEIGEESGDEEEGRMEIAEKEESDNESADGEDAEMADESKEAEVGDDIEDAVEDADVIEDRQDDDEEEVGSGSERE